MLSAPPAVRAQRKYWACTAIFSSWVERSELPPLVEWCATKKEYVSKRDEDGAVRVPTPEMIVDFLLHLQHCA